MFSRRFTIRSLLVLTAVVALVSAFPVRRAMQQKQGRAWVTQQRGHVSLGRGFSSNSTWIETSSGRQIPRFLVDLLGVDLFIPVEHVVLDCDEVQSLQGIVNLPSLKSLFINIEVSPDLDFSPLTQLRNLEVIYLSRWAAISPEQQEELQHLIPNVTIEHYD